MLQNWLKPLSPQVVKSAKGLPDHCFGQHILLHDKDMPSLKHVRVALIGIEEKEANTIREALYPTVYAFAKGAVVDMGNLRRAEPSMLMPVVFELLSGRILPILIAGTDEMARAQFMAYQEAKSLINLAVVDERLRMTDPKNTPASEHVYTSLVQPRHPLLLHFGAVGFQTHLTPPAILDIFLKNHFDAVRLGKSRAAMEETEPVLRDADLLAFHLAALKQSEAPGVEKASPSGFFVEEACQLCRYAGMSDKLTSLGIYGFCPDKDRDQQTVQVISQLIWYFLEGFFSRKNDFPASKDGLLEYIVDYREFNYQLTFWKSARSGRWWMQTPVNTKKKHQRHYLIPCSFQDYQAACRGELPDRLMQALNRFA